MPDPCFRDGDVVEGGARALRTSALDRAWPRRPRRGPRRLDRTGLDRRADRLEEQLAGLGSDRRRRSQGRRRCTWSERGPGERSRRTRGAALGPRTARVTMSRKVRVRATGGRSPRARSRRSRSRGSRAAAPAQRAVLVDETCPISPAAPMRPLRTAAPEDEPAAHRARPAHSVPQPRPAPSDSRRGRRGWSRRRGRGRRGDRQHPAARCPSRAQAAGDGLSRRRGGTRHDREHLVEPGVDRLDGSVTQNARSAASRGARGQGMRSRRGACVTSDSATRRERREVHARDEAEVGCGDLLRAAARARRRRGRRTPLATSSLTMLDTVAGDGR